MQGVGCWGTTIGPRRLKVQNFHHNNSFCGLGGGVRLRESGPCRMAVHLALVLLLLVWAEVGGCLTARLGGGEEGAVADVLSAGRI